MHRFLLPAVALALLLLPAAARAEDPPTPAATTVHPIQAMVDALMPEVARLRGLEWKRPVVANVLNRTQLVEHMLADLDTEYPP